jgi:transposase-like protein
MDDYPQALADLEQRFSTEAACRAYLERLRWPGGFRCPRCAGAKAWLTRRGLRTCASCGHDASATAGTIFARTHTPLTVWFRAIWWVTSQKNGASALGLQRVLGLGSYKTAWTCLHKLRRAMVRPGRDALTGRVEVDETFVGGVEPGEGRRRVGSKSLVLVATEVRGRSIGRIRLVRIADSSAQAILPAIAACVAKGSVVATDGLPTYAGLPALGYRHVPRVVRGSGRTASSHLPRVHRVAALLKRWLLGTHQGAVRREYLDYYLDEFTFRFNRRASGARGKLFARLLEQAVAIPPTTEAAIRKGSRSPAASRSHKR